MILEVIVILIGKKSNLLIDMDLTDKIKLSLLVGIKTILKTKILVLLVIEMKHIL